MARPPLVTVARSKDCGVVRGKSSQLPSPGAAVALVLTFTSCTVTQTCEYRAVTFEVAETSVRAPQAARAHAAKSKLTRRRFRVRMKRSNESFQRTDKRAVMP